MSYLPENYPASRETVAFQEALQPEVGVMWAARDDLLAQLDPWTAEWGLDYWEAALGLSNGQGVDLDVRRRAVVAKLQGRATTTPEVVKNVAETLLGVPVKVIEVFDEYRVELEVELGLVPGAELPRLKEQMRQIMPAHLDWACVIPVLAQISLTPRVGPRCSEVTLDPYRPGLPGIPAGMTSWLGCVASVSTLPMAEREGG